MISLTLQVGGLGYRWQFDPETRVERWIEFAGDHELEVPRSEIPTVFVDAVTPIRDARRNG